VERRSSATAAATVATSARRKATRRIPVRQRAKGDVQRIFPHPFNAWRRKLAASSWSSCERKLIRQNEVRQRERLALADFSHPMLRAGPGPLPERMTVILDFHPSGTHEFDLVVSLRIGDRGGIVVPRLVIIGRGREHLAIGQRTTFRIDDSPPHCRG